MEAQADMAHMCAECEPRVSNPAHGFDLSVDNKLRLLLELEFVELLGQR